jgi:hypothetical protein
VHFVWVVARRRLVRLVSASACMQYTHSSINPLYSVVSICSGSQLTIIITELLRYCSAYVIQSTHHLVSRQYNNGLRAGRPGCYSLRRRFFFFYIASRPALVPILAPVQWVPGALSPGIKRQGREGDRSLTYV